MTNNYLIHWYTSYEKWGEILWEQNFERLWDVTENQVIGFVNSQKKHGVEKIWYEII